VCNAQEATAILAAVNYFYNLSRATVHEVGVCPLEAVAYANLDSQGLPLVCVYVINYHIFIVFGTQNIGN
jgi:hypothetical protein